MNFRFAERAGSYETIGNEKPLIDVRALLFVVESIIPQDAEGMKYLPEDAFYGYVYDRLSDAGYDAEEVLLAAGVIQERSNHEV